MTAESFHHKTSWITALFVAVSVGLLYFFTAARDIVVGDSPELIMVAVKLGVAHSPGYPLFTMLGHLFSLLPLGSIPFRLNLFASVCDALAVAFVYLTALRWCRSQPAAILAALVLATNSLFWSWSLAAEVFPLNNLLASILIYLLVRWHEKPEQHLPFILAAFVAGLGFTNHQTIILLAPACLYLLWGKRAVLLARPRILFIAAAAFALALLPYAYVPWASAQHPVYNWGNVSSLHDLATLIARRSYGSGRLVSNTAYSGGSFLLRILALLGSFGSLGTVLGVIGLIHAFRRTRDYAWFVVIAFICAGPFFVAITNLNISTAPSALFVLQRFFLLSHVIVAPLYAFSVLAIVGLLTAQSLRRKLCLGLTTAAVFAGIIFHVARNYRRINQSHNFIARRFGEDMFATLDPGTLLLADGDGVALPLLYLQQVEGFGRDVTLVVLPLLRAPWYVGQLRARYPTLHIPFDYYDAGERNMRLLVEANPGRPICFTGSLGNDTSLDADYRPHQHGLVVMVDPKWKRMTIDQFAAENERWLNGYRPPSAQSVRTDSFENDILTLYAWPAFQVGHQYERVGSRAQARQWYEKALAIHPHLEQARQSLAGLN